METQRRTEICEVIVRQLFAQTVTLFGLSPHVAIVTTSLF